VTTTVLILLATYLAAVADTALAPVLAIYHVTPTLLPLVVIVTTVLAAPSPWRIAQMAAVGLAFDFNTNGHAGVGLVCFALTATMLLQARGLLRRLDPLEQALACVPIVAAMLTAVSFGNFLVLFTQGVGITGIAFARAGAASVYTAALTLPVWTLAAWLRQSRQLRPAARSL
jgi:cell shape-determining protein MreD